MKEFLLISFLITIFFMATANRMRNYVKILAVQGVLMFAVALVELTEVSTVNLIWILFETLIFKAVVVPFFLMRIMKRNHITRESEPYLSHFASLIIAIGIMVGTFLLTEKIGLASLDKLFFAVALSTIFFGLYFIVSHRKILSHVMGYVMIENGIFIMSLAIGNHMPLLVNLGVLLDIFASVLILGIFVNEIGDVFNDVDIDNLTELKD
ncbi:MAG: hypothetical protein HUJ92_04110 [Bacteroidales bacterium]|nr:hypothetical protein [Bacteroidales bacterium]